MCFNSVHQGINPPSKTPPPPLFLAKLPLNQQTVQAPFLGNLSPSLLVFRDSPLKVRFFSEPKKY